MLKKPLAKKTEQVNFENLDIDFLDISKLNSNVCLMLIHFDRKEARYYKPIGDREEERLSHHLQYSEKAKL